MFEDPLPDQALPLVEYVPATGLLVVGARQRRLTPRASALLERLVETPGRVVSKEELLAEVWGGLAVTDEAVTTVVYELRQALGDSASSPRFVETLRKRGYRWIAPLPKIIPAGAAPRRGTDAPRSRRRRWIALAATVTVGLFMGGHRLRSPEIVQAAVPTAACDLYLRGVELAKQGTAVALRGATERLEQALAVSPAWPPGYLALAEAYLALAARSGAPAIARSRAAVRRAEELGASPAEVHAVRAALRLDADGDVAGAAAELVAARTASHCGEDRLDLRTAEVLLVSGRVQRAIALLERLAESQPAAPSVERALGRAYEVAGSPELAELHLMRALESAPDHVPTLRRLAAVRERRGNASGSFAALRREAYLMGLSPNLLVELQGAWQGGGLAAVRDWRIEHAEALGLDAVELAGELVLAHEPERAVAGLRLARSKRLTGLAWVAVEPEFETLRRDGRFRGLLEQIAPKALPASSEPLLR